MNLPWRPAIVLACASLIGMIANSGIVPPTGSAEYPSSCLRFPRMKRACFPEETSSTSFYKRVNEIQAKVPSGAIAEEGIGAKRRALISEGCKPCPLFPSSVMQASYRYIVNPLFSSADEKPMNLASKSLAGLDVHWPIFYIP